MTLGGLDTRPVRLGATPHDGGLMVSITNASAMTQTVDMSHELFDPDSVRVAEGVVAEQRLALKPDEVIECALALDAAKEAGTYTVKLTAVTESGERVIELAVYEVK